MQNLRKRLYQKLLPGKVPKTTGGTMANFCKKNFFNFMVSLSITIGSGLGLGTFSEKNCRRSWLRHAPRRGALPKPYDLRLRYIRLMHNKFLVHRKQTKKYF